MTTRTVASTNGHLLVTVLWCIVFEIAAFVAAALLIKAAL